MRPEASQPHLGLRKCVQISSVWVSNCANPQETRAALLNLFGLTNCAQCPSDSGWSSKDIHRTALFWYAGSGPLKRLETHGDRGAVHVGGIWKAFRCSWTLTSEISQS